MTNEQHSALRMADRFEGFAIDHMPEGWPGVRQHELSAAALHLRKLHAENADLYAEIERAIDTRDTAEGWADGLASLIGEYFGEDIGEHSNLHNPWQEARNIIEEAAQYKHAPVALGDAEVLSMSQALFMMRDADARDAARYRWLRGRNLDAISAGGVFAGMTPANVVLNGKDMDASIDAAMAKEGGAV